MADVLLALHETVEGGRGEQTVKPAVASEFAAGKASSQNLVLPSIPRSAPLQGRGLPRLRHRRETLPKRPPRVPVWRPTRRAEATGPGRSVLEGWHDPEVIVMDDLGCMRVSFTYNQMSSVSAVYSQKARRAHYDESAHEAAFLRWFTVDTRFTAIQFQPFTILVRTNTGKVREYTVDALFETQDGILGCTEIKATPEYFNDPETDDKLSFFSRTVESLGITSGITRWAASSFTNDISRNIKDIYDKRNTGFDADHAELARRIISANGGISTLGTVAAALPLRSLDAQDALRAMACRRLVGIDLTRPFCPDLPIFIPPEPARPGALRAFQAQFLPGNAE